MEAVDLPVASAIGVNGSKASILTSPDYIKIAYVSSSQGDSSEELCQQLTILTVAGDASCEEIVAKLPKECISVGLLRGPAIWQQMKQQPETARDQDLAGTLADKNLKLSLYEASEQQLTGLAYCWPTGADHQPLATRLWHASPPLCDQLVGHSPSWQRINDRLARRMLRREAPVDSGTLARLPLIVAELGPGQVRLRKIDSDLSVTSLVREPFLGYRNLLGLAQLSKVPPMPRCSDGGDESVLQLRDLLDSAASGSATKLDLTISDLLPAESAYGHYDPKAAVFTLGKLHDFKSLDELQPSPSDVAASLTYAFIKTFFDTIVHATSAQGIPRVAVVGEFFQSEWCRARFMETWNFTGVSKEALNFQFLRHDCGNLLALIGGLL